MLGFDLGIAVSLLVLLLLICSVSKINLRTWVELAVGVSLLSTKSETLEIAKCMH